MNLTGQVDELVRLSRGFCFGILFVVCRVIGCVVCLLVGCGWIYASDCGI